MSNPVTLAVHELEALLEKAKAAAEHIIHPTEAAPVAAVEPAVPTPSPAPVAPVAPAVPTPAKVAQVVHVAKPAGVKIAGQNYAKDGLTQEWHAR